MRNDDELSSKMFTLAFCASIGPTATGDDLHMFEDRDDEELISRRRGDECVVVAASTLCVSRKGHSSL